MDKMEPNKLSEIFSDDVKSAQDKIKILRSKYDTEEELLNSAEWQEFKEESSNLMNDIVKKHDELNIREIERRLKLKNASTSKKQHTNFSRRTPLPNTVVAIIIILFLAAIYLGATT